MVVQALAATFFYFTKIFPSIRNVHIFVRYAVDRKQASVAGAPDGSGGIHMAKSGWFKKLQSVLGIAPSFSDVRSKRAGRAYRRIVVLSDIHYPSIPEEAGQGCRPFQSVPC